MVAFGVEGSGGNVAFWEVGDEDALTDGICGLVEFAGGNGADELAGEDGLVALGINDDERRDEFEDDEEEDIVIPALEDSAFPDGYRKGYNNHVLC